MFSYLKTSFLDTKVELSKVFFPTKEQFNKYAISVVIVSSITASYLGVIDASMSSIIGLF
jgi:preprotein translocase SecE subunit